MPPSFSSLRHSRPRVVAEVAKAENEKKKKKK